MRWLLIHPGPNWSVADVHNGWAEALTGLGEQVREYALDKRLLFYNMALHETGNADTSGYPEVRKAVSFDEAAAMASEGLRAACFDWWPDVVLCTSAFYTPPFSFEVIRSRGMRVVMLFTEAPYQTGTQLKMAPYADLCLVNDPCDIEKYRAVTAAEYMPHAYRPAVHHPGPPVPAMVCDLGFVGTGFPSRIKFFEAMDLDGLDVLLGGPWMALDEGSPLRPMVAHDLGECLDNDQTADVYRSARAGINLYRREAEDGAGADGWAMGPREVEMAACGLFYLRDPRGEGDEVLPMLPTFDGPGDASEKLRWWLDHPGLRDEAARKARAAVADRTFKNNAESLLRLLDRQPAKV